MKISKIEVKSNWREVADAARTTVNMDEGTGEPSRAWRKKLLLSEHSPARQMIIKWKWSDLKYWVSVHFVRHKVGIEHFVGTQRTDRTGVDREESKQSALVTHECIANAQSVVNISRKRLCTCASKETREAWKVVLDELEPLEPEIVSVCVPECVYRGFCPEMKSCGYNDTESYAERLVSYRNVDI